MPPPSIDSILIAILTSPQCMKHESGGLHVEVPAFKYRQVFGGLSLMRMRDLHAAITVLSRR